MKKLLAIILAALLLTSLVACSNKNENEAEEEENDNKIVTEYAEGDFLYDVNDDGNYKIIGYTYTGIEKKDVVIPATIGEDERAVTAIDADAFKALHNIQSVVIPESVLVIGAHAFYDCDFITNITIPASVTMIGAGAFENCSALETVTLNKGLLELGVGAFMNCEKLATITLPDGLMTIGAGAFKECNALTEITIPTSVIYLGDAAFYGCDLLEKVTALDGTLETLAEMNAALAAYMAVAGNTAPDTFEKVLEILTTAEVDVEGLAEIGYRFSWDKENNCIVATDAAILDAMNAVLAAYTQKNGDAPEKFQQVKTALEAAGIYMGETSANGCKYVWVKESNVLAGALSTADAEALVKYNAAITENVPTFFDEILTILKGAELEMGSFNTVVSSNKYVWNATTNTMENMYIGSAVFGNCSLDFEMGVTAGSLMASYAEAENYQYVING